MTTADQDLSLSLYILYTTIYILCDIGFLANGNFSLLEEESPDLEMTFPFNSYFYTPTQYQRVSVRALPFCEVKYNITVRLLKWSTFYLHLRKCHYELPTLFLNFKDC